ncbi:NAD-dependent deacetylase sir2A-like isoform X1 [Hydra vulgaris]|uniref:NAD-dependent deacetylase sir2A-like isoform X1 n=1 Tax=Hydra vulgaris TaxID=6087 RepID=UPI0032EA737E
MAEASCNFPDLFAVDVKTNCPHIREAISGNITIDINLPCKLCSNQGENWICLTCSQTFCSRYVNKHMLHHSTETSHPIGLSFLDASVWCYLCDSYIDSPILQEISRSVALAKDI